MATVDSLDIRISAQANSASAIIDKLVGKLNTLSSSLSGINGSGLTGLANGVNRLSASMQSMKTVGTADFTRLAKNIQKLGNINVANLNSAASSMSHLTRAFNQLGGVSTNAQQVGVLASNLSKLGYKSINNAITNLPALTRELDNLMTTLSRAPRVSNNVIQMTNALANLASKGGRVGIASRTLVSGLNNSTNAMNRAKKSSTSLAAAFGKFYASWFLAIRGIKSLWKSVESSMNYVEVLNYFDAAFDQVAQKADLSKFQEMGYDSAEEYAKSFSERAKELTAQMTGFAVTEKGTLESTGMPSLGIDPSQLMKYQAMFGQMSSSMGVASETSLKLSRALTEIGADLASVKNMDFDKVWTDMASGLAGMSRTLDKYGVNIRNVNLQQKLTELGIDANIQALNQNDKALLRTIVLLDSTRYAWGDMADTINQPANQLRLINSGFQNLGRIIGGLFLPMVQQVLPYINGLVIALQRLFTWVGNLLGIDLSKVTQSVGDTDFSNIIEGADDVSGSLDDAAGNAKKLKQQLQGFDELNVLTSQDTSGAGAGAGISSGLLDAAFEDALSEYQDHWNESFANMENRAQELADKVENALQPIKDIIQDFAVGDFFQAGQDVSNLVVSINDFFARAIDNVDWYGIGNKIGDFLAGIDWISVLSSVGNLIWQALKAAIELWSGSFDAAPIETGIITAIAGLTWVGIIPALAASIRKALSPTAIAGLITGTISTALSGNAISWPGTPAFDVIGNWILDKITRVLEELIPNWALDFLGKLGAGIVVGAVAGSWFPGAGTVAGAIVGGIIGALDGIKIDGISILDTIVKKIFNFDTAFFFFEEAQKSFEKAFDGKRKGWLDIGASILKGILDGFLGAFSFIAEPITDFFTWIGEEICDVFGIEGPAKEMAPFGENILLGIIEGFTSKISDFNKAIQDWFNESVKPWFTAERWSGAMSGIKTAFNQTFKNAINSVTNLFNRLIDGINEKMHFQWDAIKIFGKEIVPAGSVQLFRIPKIPQFEAGGFPKEYSLFMAGEHGRAEMLGTVGGQTAVAGGEEITGIRDAVYSTSQQEVELLRQQNQLLQAILEKEYGISTNDIGKAARDYSREYYKKTGKPAYNF